ncbi:MAG: response regulator [Thermoplasmatota archaeon]
MKVLFVDDEEGIREQAKIYLERIYGSLDVTTAEDAEKAMEELEDSYFAVVVCDYKMPGMSGIELLKELREEGNDVPFIIFTGKGKEEIAMQALNFGADGYIQKEDDPRSQYTFMAQTIKQVVQNSQSLNALERSEKEKTIILDSLSEHVVHLDRDLHIIWCNRSAAETAGKKIGELVGEYCYEIWFDRKQPCEGCPVLKALEEKKTVKNVLVSKEGVVWDIGGHLVKGEGNEVIGLIETKQNITEQRIAKRFLRESEDRFETLVKNTPSGIFILKDCKFVFANPAMQSITGYSEGELISTDFLKMVSPSQKKIVRKRILGVQRDEKVPRRFEINIIGKSGWERWIYVSLSNIKYEGERGVIMSAVDITEKKELFKVLEK